MTIFLLLGVGLFFVSIIQFTFETLTVCAIVYLFLIPVGIYNYRVKTKTTNKGIVPTNIIVELVELIELAELN